MPSCPEEAACLSKYHVTKVKKGEGLSWAGLCTHALSRMKQCMLVGARGSEDTQITCPISQFIDSGTAFNTQENRQKQGLATDCAQHCAEFIMSVLNFEM